MLKLQNRLRSLILILNLGMWLVAATPLGEVQAAPTQTKLLPFAIFVATVVNGDSRTIRGVYVPDVMALKVKPQPLDDLLYVSKARDAVTQFGLPRLGVVGLLAHNYLAGSTFFDLAVGQEVRLVYGDGSVKYLVVTAIYQYQAFDSNGAQGHYVDLNTGADLSETELYAQMYLGSPHLTFQTCIANGDNLLWGRLFVVAQPLKEPLRR